jgi:hypothetical protein
MMAIEPGVAKGYRNGALALQERICRTFGAHGV